MRMCRFGGLHIITCTQHSRAVVATIINMLTDTMDLSPCVGRLGGAIAGSNLSRLARDLHVRVSSCGSGNEAHGGERGPVRSRGNCEPILPSASESIPRAQAGSSLLRDVVGIPRSERGLGSRWNRRLAGKTGGSDHSISSVLSTPSTQGCPPVTVPQIDMDILAPHSKWTL